MRSSLIIREFLSRYQQKLKLTFTSREVGLEREIKLSRQASNTFDAADYFNLLQINGYNAAQDFIPRQKQAVSQDFELLD